MFGPKFFFQGCGSLWCVKEHEYFHFKRFMHIFYSIYCIVWKRGACVSGSHILQHEAKGNIRARADGTHEPYGISHSRRHGSERARGYHERVPNRIQPSSHLNRSSGSRNRRPASFLGDQLRSARQTGELHSPNWALRSFRSKGSCDQLHNATGCSLDARTGRFLPHEDWRAAQKRGRFAVKTKPA